ncbi:LuxR C-terminal-related transcriptional regulator [Enterobacteriaceae bacterium H11S18]|uniref:LuxR C-terminal-related transcriptional regulator n=1 Tax=Dryocola clanedunensis TaxID=2925396 RepID=UPI0022F10483|nr:LuxR C-terminal-related transcriptional regulator [Dryocola clanedunensis]MCT4712104.1 LuxR C-terminal-related transcriptional regulator [Dryocola clanedunensis]
MIIIISDDAYFALGAEEILTAAGHNVRIDNVSTVAKIGLSPYPNEQDIILLSIANRKLAISIMEIGQSYHLPIVSVIGVPYKEKHTHAAISGVATKSMPCHYLPAIITVPQANKSSYQIDKLTLREIEVMNFLVSGESIDNISTTLSIRPKTVSSHKCSALKKMGMNRMNSHAVLAYEKYRTLF